MDKGDNFSTALSAVTRPMPGILVGHDSLGLIEYFAMVGFEWVLLDVEHHPLSARECWDAVVLGQALGLRVGIRVPSFDSAAIGWSVDSGADFILAPAIVSADDVAQFIDNVNRVGLYSKSRRIGYGIGEGAPSRTRPLLGVLIESQEASMNLDEILASDIDLFAVGPSDLADSMGLVGQPRHPRVLEEVEHITKEVREAGKNLVLPGGHQEQIELAIRQDATMVLTDVIALLTAGGRRFLAASGSPNISP